MIKTTRILLDPDPNAAGGGAGGDNAELAKAIEKARLEERTRLKDQLTALTTQVDTIKTQLTAVQTEKEKLSTEFSSLKTTYEALKAGSKPDGGVDVEKAIETAVTAALSKQGPVLQSEIANLRGELEQERKKREAAELAQSRARIIEEAGGQTALIPELVVGSNEAELRAAAERSKQILARSLQAATGGSSSGSSSTANGAGNSGLPSVPLGAASANGGAAASAGNNNPLVPGGRMSMKEFAAKRNELKAAALSRARG